ncbi:aef4d8f2-d2d7-42f7-be27-616ca4457229 [Thermothielavioides terrestris]|nr:aef4d8f2-d2d7-42f7-be27-616ca4457229 [Thermothielavioides terrestris]
MSRLSK